MKCLALCVSFTCYLARDISFWLFREGTICMHTQKKKRREGKNNITKIEKNNRFGLVLLSQNVSNSKKNNREGDEWRKLENNEPMKTIVFLLSLKVLLKCCQIKGLLCPQKKQNNFMCELKCLHGRVLQFALLLFRRGGPAVFSSKWFTWSMCLITASMENKKPKYNAVFPNASFLWTRTFRKCTVDNLLCSWQEKIVIQIPGKRESVHI